VLPSRAVPAPPGTIVASRQGTGAAEIALPGASTGSHLTLRLACLGRSAADLVNAAGVSELHVRVCPSLGVLYDSQFKATAADRTIRVVLSPSTHWSLTVWAG
jgi:hypothetical protein